MVSKREVREIFRTVAPNRQLPESTLEEFAFRAKSLLEIYASMCEFQAGGEESNKRLTIHDVKLAFLRMEDLLTRSPQVEKQAEEEELSQQEKVERAMMLENEAPWKHRREKEEEEEEEEFGEWNNELE